MTTKKLSIKLRLGTMLLDHVIMSLLVVPPMIITSFFINSKPFETHPVETFLFYAILVIYLNKDIANGKSLSKRILGLVVIDYKTGEPASEFKCFLRNITIIFWPIEVIVSLFSPNRRLGDFIANTKLEASEKEPVASILPDLREITFNKSVLQTLIAGVVYAGSLWFVMEKILP